MASRRGCSTRGLTRLRGAGRRRPDGGGPGTVHVWTEGLPTTSASSAGGSHALGVAYALALGDALDRVPERLAVIGIEAADARSGRDVLAVDVAAAVDLAVELVARLVTAG